MTRGCVPGVCAGEAGLRACLADGKVGGAGGLDGTISGGGAGPGLGLLNPCVAVNYGCIVNVATPASPTSPSPTKARGPALPAPLSPIALPLPQARKSCHRFLLRVR
ncbi:hypothetical protein R1sor_019321 [Riccia sorocarpa]|uniref:Uncharacterized protein n=1 Tax=Riccia sorocarpa TaxID=122646 RepID=A0ABD3IIE1_9MARC